MAHQQREVVRGTVVALNGRFGKVRSVYAARANAYWERLVQHTRDLVPTMRRMQGGRRRFLQERLKNPVDARVMWSEITRTTEDGESGYLSMPRAKRFGKVGVRGHSVERFDAVEVEFDPGLLKIQVRGWAAPDGTFEDNFLVKAASEAFRRMEWGMDGGVIRRYNGRTGKFELDNWYGRSGLYDVLNSVGITSRRAICWQQFQRVRSGGVESDIEALIYSGLAGSHVETVRAVLN